MRYIDLDKHKPDQAWLDKSDALTAELIRLHEAGDIAARNKLIDDNASHWGQIKQWLLDISHNKCWFSEAKDIYSHLDVEHFRPKKVAKALDGTERDGYWWLAFDYTNFRACGNVGNRKKGGWFPLKQGSLVSSYDAPCEESEANYLLDPTDPDDVLLLAFDEEGNAIPEPSISEWEKQRVEETIKRLKLNEHEALTEQRRTVWQTMSRHIEQYQTAKSKCAGGNNPAAKGMLKERLKNITAMMNETAELSSVAKYCVLFRNDQQLIRLLG